MRRTVALGRFGHEGFELTLGVLDRLADDAARRRDADVEQLELLLNIGDVAADPLGERFAGVAMRRNPGPDRVASPVSTIGLARTAAASTTASRSGLPAARAWWMESISRIALRTRIPDRQEENTSQLQS